MERLDSKGVVAHEDHEPLRNGRARSPLRAAEAVKIASSRGAHGVTRPTGKGRFRERIDGKAVVTHEDREPLRNGRARSPLRAADAVNVASSGGAHGVTRPTGKGRFRERGSMAEDLSRVKTINRCATVGRAVLCAPRMQSTLHPAAARTE